jgi:hypothetical protein
MMPLKRRNGVLFLTLLTLGVRILRPLAGAESVPAVPVLTPKDVIAWMAPMRIENGRLSIDWGTVGLIAARHAGISVNGDRVTASIDTDVKFFVSAATAGTAAATQAPEFQLTLHADGGSPAGRSQDELARDVPISVRIVENGVASGLRGEFTVHGKLSKDGQSYDASEMKLNLDSSTCLALYAMNRKTREYRMKFKEDRILKMDLSVSDTNNILLIRMENTDVGTGFDFTQKPNGEAELSYSQGEAKRMVKGSSFHDLVQNSAAEMQLNFFRPLAEAGVNVTLCPDLPVVMAATVTGFSDPLPESSRKADALIKSVAEAATPVDRAKAVTDVTRYFPQAIQRITQAMEKTDDPLLKAALQKAIAAHPGIARAMPYVQLHKLEDDRDYLFDIFEHVPLFHDAARARLIRVIGKDYGDTIDDWKKK